MKYGLMGSLVLECMKICVASGCVLGLLTGCSSQLRTTIVSADSSPTVKVADLEPEAVAIETVVVQSVPKSPMIDIPIEQPARPASRREFSSEILATPKSTLSSPEILSLPESQEVDPAEEPIMLSMPSVTESPVKPAIAGIPSIEFEPEVPALPRRSSDGDSVSPQILMAPVTKLESPTLVSPALKKDSIQVAKVIPQEAAPAEMVTKVLEASLRDIYFDYDRFAIREDAAELLKKNAELLSTGLLESKIVIEGHCDERGTQSYNIVLGEARANAVKTFLEDLGIPRDKLEVVSYGKDKPFCRQQTEECWQENRRGHFVIK